MRVMNLVVFDVDTPTRQLPPIFWSSNDRDADSKLPYLLGAALGKV
jgi:hypothetical protein